MAGRLFGVGVGPGDPELMTVKAVRAVQRAPVIAYFAARTRPSNARAIAAGYITDEHIELRLDYPVTTEKLDDSQSYHDLLVCFYDESAARVVAELTAGNDVVVLCEGDPMFYGSYMYLHNRLSPMFATTVIPGVSSVGAGAAAIATPLVCLDELFSVISGVLPADELKTRLAAADAAIVLKLGRNLHKVREVIASLGLLDRAVYVERASSDREYCCPLAMADAATAPYFSMIVIPSAVAGNR